MFRTSLGKSLLVGAPRSLPKDEARKNYRDPTVGPRLQEDGTPDKLLLIKLIDLEIVHLSFVLCEWYESGFKNKVNSMVPLIVYLFALKSGSNLSALLLSVYTEDGNHVTFKCGSVLGFIIVWINYDETKANKRVTVNSFARRAMFVLFSFYLNTCFPEHLYFKPCIWGFGVNSTKI